MILSDKAIEARRRNALAPNSGKRGKASHTLETVEAKKLFVQKVHEHLIPIFEALLYKALEGDVSATKELLDRAWGKAVQGVEVSGTDGQPIVFMPIQLLDMYALQDTPNVVKSKVIDVTPRT